MGASTTATYRTGHRSSGPWYGLVGWAAVFPNTTQPSCGSAFIKEKTTQRCALSGCRLLWSLVQPTFPSSRQWAFSKYENGFNGRSRSLPGGVLLCETLCALRSPTYHPYRRCPAPLAQVTALVHQEKRQLSNETPLALADSRGRQTRLSGLEERCQKNWKS